MVSSISTRALSSIPATIGALFATLTSHGQATESSRRTWPKVNARRSETSVEGA